MAIREVTGVVLTAMSLVLVLVLAGRGLADDYPYQTAEPQTSGWPLTAEERTSILKAEHERRPGSEVKKHLSEMWPVESSAGFWGATSWLETQAKLVEHVKENEGVADFLLVGDSITQQGGSLLDKKPMNAAWVKQSGKAEDANIGMGRDKSQNVLRRLDHGGVVLAWCSYLRGQTLPPAMGPHVGLHPQAYEGVNSFGPQERLVMSHYFTWYDEPTGAHFFNPDGSDALTTHPALTAGYSYKLASWHKKQLEDMVAAGIDVVLPVYWGAPSEQEPGSHHYWSFEGLGPMVRAMRELEQEGKQPPRVGLFYDTSTLRHNSWGYHADLRDERGKEWFYASIRDFFSMIPPKFWALIEGKPVVVLYTSGFAKGHDPSSLEHVKTAFAKDFGGREPYVIREVSWNIRAENLYAWGGAIKPNFLGVAEIGPGYDHTAVPGREPLITSRQGGKFYEEAWIKAIRREPKIVIVETWNEHHEGTDIAESREYGRQYIELTRKYADLFKQGWTPPPVTGPYTGAHEVEIVFSELDQERGLERVEVEDGKTVPVVVNGEQCRRPVSESKGARYCYFMIDESFKKGPAMDAVIDVEYFDGFKGGTIGLQFDRDDPEAAYGGAYTVHQEVVKPSGELKWRTARFAVEAARFGGRQNGGADFRLVIDGPEVAIRRVVLKAED